MDKDALLQQIKDCLQDACGDRLRGVVLYGSEVRAAADDESDIDVLVLLDGPIHLGRDIDTCTKAIYPLMLEIGRTIDAAPVDIRDYEAGNDPLYRAAKKEGILA